MNFEMAQDLADLENIAVETIVVDDDIAVEDSTYTAGKRAVAGTVFVHKILGAAALKEKAEESSYDNLSDLFQDVRMTLVSKIGGASGPLYGSAFIEMAKKARDTEEIGEILEAGLEGIQKRGKADVGEKTMVDEWAPVIEHIKSGSLTNEIIQESLEKTKDMKATKGRASYLGDRSIGHIDPGAQSSAYLFEALLEAGVLDD